MDGWHRRLSRLRLLLLYWRSNLTENKWQPDDPLLTSKAAPFEGSAVSRMDRAGWPGNSIMRMCAMQAYEVVQAIRVGRMAEASAKGMNRRIHDAKLPHGFQYKEER